MIDLASALLVVVVMSSAGMALLRLLRALPAEPADRLLAACAAGFGLTGMAGLGLAAVGALRPIPLAMLGIAAMIGGGPDLWAAMRSVRLRWNWATGAAAAIATAVLATAAVAALAPPVGGDQTKYHLVYPRLFAAHGGLVPTPWSFWGTMQYLPNFVFAVAFALRDDVLVRLLNVATGAMAAGALGRLAARHLAPGCGLATATLAMSLPITWTLMTRAEVDLPLVAFVALGATAVADWARDVEDVGHLRRAAVFAGLAGGSKIMGLLVPALLGLGVLVVLARRVRPFAAQVRLALLYGALAMIALSPCYVRNAATTGDPLHPFGHGVFHGAHWSPEASAYLDDYYQQYQRTHAARREGEPYRGVEVLRFPWDLTMHPESFENTSRQGLDPGPFMLAFLPGVLLARRYRWTAIAIAAFGLAHMGIIASAAWSHPRYVFPGTMMLLVAAVAGGRALLGARGFTIVVVLTILGHGGTIARSLREPLWRDQVRVATGRLGADEFLRRNSSRYRFWERANAAMQADDQVVLLEKIPHPYYVSRPFILASYLEQGWIDYRTMESPLAFAERVRATGTTHAAIDLANADAVGDPFEARVKELWRAYLAEWGELVLREADYALYVLRPVTAIVGEERGTHG